ncbi:MAG TPA: outer membrane lipoprotein-sorting protein [Oligoflexus sp.]|uniref:outer membrane lipoprotein-sorting protein n=1 Tax=Oligoflexus sp. TaxID=1971216 RepID=UPI002D80480C|nr:outer membrane lipoprotein-sorting protein [Oligoflexus sp.]HET9236913.1 outer membrane lipoprotein-sorting protein [Oligoflexus sp.]
MKRFLVTLVLLLPFTASAADKPVDVRAIVAEIEGNMAPKGYQSVNSFVNTRTDGTVMSYEVKFQSKDVDHHHGVFIKPEREKGREILRLGDNLWTWMPSVGRVVRIADRDSFAGGDFSNADILRVDWLNRYNPELVKETPKQWIIDLKAKTPEAPYAKMRLWVDKESHQPVQQQYYDSNGTLLKRLLYGSVQKFGKVERPAHLLMENVITKQKSELKILEMRFDVPIPDSRFVVDNLGK